MVLSRPLYSLAGLTVVLELKGMWLTFDKKAHQNIVAEGISCFIEKALPSTW
jgi:hypothetical protein